MLILFRNLRIAVGENQSIPYGGCFFYFESIRTIKFFALLILEMFCIIFFKSFNLTNPDSTAITKLLPVSRLLYS